MTEGKEKRKRGRSKSEISTEMASLARLNSTMMADLNGNGLGGGKKKKKKRQRRRVTGKKKKKIELLGLF